MTMAPEHREKVTHWLSAKGYAKPCVVCGNAKFSNLEDFVLMHAVTAETMDLRVGQLFAGLICLNCGNTQFIHAPTMGITL